MTTTIQQPVKTEAQGQNGGSGHPSCEQCGAPMDHQQRFCVNCATRRTDASDPASTYFATMSRRNRQSALARRAPGGSPARGAAVVFFALLPAAVGLGVVVGHSGGTGSGGVDPQVLAALKAGTAGAASGAGADALASTGSQSLPSDFTLAKGYTVMLQKLPVNGTDEQAAKSAESDATGKGAPKVGLISPKDFTTKPDQGQSYIVYSGEYKAKGDAQAALGKLKKDFSSAQVIEVTSTTASASAGSSSGSVADAPAAGGTKVLAQTSHGAVHQVAGATPSQADLQTGAQIAQREASQTGGAYINSQRDLPDIIAVGGDGTAPPPSGAGD